MNHLLDLPKVKLAYEQSIKCIYGISEEGIQIDPLNKKGNLGVKINGWSSKDYCIQVGNKNYIPMSTCDYLGLSRNQKVITASKKAIDKYGTGATGVRALTGNIDLYYELEEKIASFIGADYCFISNSGYVINAFLIPLLFGEETNIFYDMFSHKSMQHGIGSSGANSIRFYHNDFNHLEKKLKSLIPSSSKNIIMADGVYSMHGTILELNKLMAIKDKHDCILWVDEAHSFGVIGEIGNGITSYFNINPKEIDFLVGTLSKSLPGIGGYICSSSINLYDLLAGSNPVSIFSSAIPPSALAASIAAIDLLKESNINERLKSNIQFFKGLMKDRGFTTISHDDSAIFLLEIGEIELAKIFTQTLLEEGVMAHEIIYPALPKNRASIRLTVTASHSKHQLSIVVEKIVLVCKKLNLECLQQQNIVNVGICVI